METNETTVTTMEQEAPDEMPCSDVGAAPSANGARRLEGADEASAPAEPQRVDAVEAEGAQEAYTDAGISGVSSAEQEPPDDGDPEVATAAAAEAAQAAETARIAALERSLLAVEDQRERLQRDFDNFRRRTEEQRPQWAQRARKAVLEESLTVFDDLQRWLDAMPTLTAEAYDAQKDGAELVYQVFAQTIARFAFEAPVPLGTAAGAPADDAAHDTTDDFADDATPPTLEEALEEAHVRLRRVAGAYRAYTRRAKLERTYEEQRARAEVIDALQPVLEALRAALDEQEDTDASCAYARLEAALVAVSTQFSAALQTFGVHIMEVLDRPFEVACHEAVGQTHMPGKEAGTVVYEVRRGYMYGDQVLRYAQVIVAA